jgi:hypothetical protein
MESKRSPIMGMWACGCIFRIGILLAGSCLYVNSAVAVDDPSSDPDVRKTIEAMHNASTWFHPDLYGLTHGMQEYVHHQYAAARKHFAYGALYADKLSQLCLGLMAMNGEGAPKDLISAYAWLDLSAERGYPQFVATRDELAKTLSVDQLDKAKRLRAKLAEKYGDAVAKPRMAIQLRLGMMNFTGSRTGFDSGVVQISSVPCGPALVFGGRVVPQIGCGAMNDFLAKENWQPKLYFAARDREWLPQVTVGPLMDANVSSDKRSEQGSETGDGAGPGSH